MSMTTISAQFNGPDNSGNGGYVAGLVAEPLTAHGAAGPVTSTLRLPPPLGTPLDLSYDGEHASLRDGEAVVAQSGPGEFDVDPAPFVGEDLARKGFEAYEGHVHHPFERCFTCGTARSAGDGLLVFTGPVDDPEFPGTVAATWTAHPAFADPEGRLTYPVLWAVIDCPGGWSADIDTTPMVLGRMTGQSFAPVAVGREYVVVGTLRGVDGRKHRTGTALYDLDGTLLARAEQTWIAINIADFR